MKNKIPLWVSILIILCACGKQEKATCEYRPYRPQPTSKADVECLYNSMIGELAGESDYEKITHLFFFDAQTKKHGKGYCYEFNTKAGGGALRWTSNTKYHIKEIRNTIDEKKEKHFRKIVMNFYTGKYCPDETQKKVMKMNHCLLRELFNDKSPHKWWNKKRIDFILTDKMAYTLHRW